MGEVESGHIHPRPDHLFKDLQRRRGRSDGADNLGFMRRQFHYFSLLKSQFSVFCKRKLNILPLSTGHRSLVTDNPFSLLTAH
jgi:hypothetical protein